MLKRTIPSTQEPLPVIGMGSWQTFNTLTPPGLENLSTVIKEWSAAGGRLIDSSPMYGKAEEAIGAAAADSGLADSLFYATKVWTRGGQEGIRQMEDSFVKMKRSVIDLLQIHNLVGWKDHLPTLRKWKESGRIRYIGITHYLSDHHEDLARIIRSEPIDFVQFNYSIFDRHAEKMILPVAQEHGVATLINRPFGEGGFLRRLSDKPLPAWVSEYGIENWAAFILKYIIGHPGVTCVIPATADVEHAVANAKAGDGFIPDEGVRRKMAEAIGKF